MKNQMLRCIAVLGGICLAVAVLLAAVNYVTAPIIAEQAKGDAEKAIRAVLPDATELESVSLTPEVPKTVKEIYRDKGGSGYAFVVQAPGYGGSAKPIGFVVGIDMTRSIIKISVTDVSGESAGIGDKVAGKDFLASFVGLDSVSGVGTISGATVSSNGFIKGVADAFTAFNAVAEFEESDEQKLARLIYEVLPGMNSNIGFASVSLPSGTLAAVKSAHRAKNSSGYAVVIGEGADTVIIGLNSYLGLYTAKNLEGETVTPSAEQLSCAVAAVTPNCEQLLSGYYASKVGALTTGNATRLDRAENAPNSFVGAYRIDGDPDVAFVFLMQSSHADGARIYAVSVDSNGATVEVSAISTAGTVTGEFDLADDLAAVYEAYKEGGV